MVKYFNNFKFILTSARKEKIIFENPAEEVILRNEKSRTIEYLTPDDYKKLDEDEISTNNSLTNQLNEALEILNDREKEIIRLRFGISNNEILTLEEIGKKLGLTRERIRQIEKKALNKINRIRGKELKGYIN